MVLVNERSFIMCNNKHLSLDERLTIEREISLGKSFKYIGSLINKDCTTISKEIRNHFITKDSGGYGRVFNNCIYRNECKLNSLCDNCHQSKNRLCRYCLKCRNVCSKYKEEKCVKLDKPPYVCNSCRNLSRCTLTKHIYEGAYAFNEYKQLLVESRSGVMINQDEIDNLNNILVPLIKEQGQSINQVFINNPNTIMHSEKNNI